MLAHLSLDPATAWRTWTLDPLAVSAGAALLVLYGRGLRRGGLRAVGRARAAWFAGGLLVVTAAVVSPLHAAAEMSVAAHMVQHLLLILVAAPLIVAGRPALVLALALPARLRRSSRRAAAAGPVAGAIGLLRRPLGILLAYAAVLWAWHLPGPYQAAVLDERVHALEHLSFLAITIAFWSAVMRAAPRRPAAYAPAMALTIGTMLQSTWLAAILTFGGLAYPVYADRAARWGVDPLADQHAAGTIMWVPSGIVYVAIFAVLFVRWFRELDRRHARTPTAAGES